MTGIRSFEMLQHADMRNEFTTARNFSFLKVAKLDRLKMPK